MNVRKILFALIAFVVAEAGLASAEPKDAPQSLPPPDPVRDRLIAACIEGRGMGTALLSVTDRIDSCSALSERDGDAFTGLFHRARVRQSVQDWGGAEEDFTAALRQQPDAVDALFERGRVRFLYLDAPDLALADFDLAASLAPERAQVHMMHALTGINLARDSDGTEVGALIGTAKTALIAYLKLTQGTQDATEKMQRDEAQDILNRLVQN